MWIWSIDVSGADAADASTPAKSIVVIDSIVVVVIIFLCIYRLHRRRCRNFFFSNLWFVFPCAHTLNQQTRKKCIFGTSNRTKITKTNCRRQPSWIDTTAHNSSPNNNNNFVFKSFSILFVAADATSKHIAFTWLHFSMSFYMCETNRFRYFLSFISIQICRFRRYFGPSLVCVALKDMESWGIALWLIRFFGCKNIFSDWRSMCTNRIQKMMWINHET